MTDIFTVALLQTEPELHQFQLVLWTYKVYAKH